MLRENHGCSDGADPLRADWAWPLEPVTQNPYAPDVATLCCRVSFASRAEPTQRTHFVIEANMKRSKREFRATLLLTLAVVTWAGRAPATEAESTLEDVHRIWKSGGTLPAEMAARFPNPPLRLANDTGVNVIVDLAHQCTFATMWKVPRDMHAHGFRTIVSHASLNTVLTPGDLSRVRIPVGKASDGKPLRPFGWVPNPRFNVLFTHQSNPDAQFYLPQERAAVKAFVENGGGVIIVDNGFGGGNTRRQALWEERSLATTFGLRFANMPGDRGGPLLDQNWEVVHTNDNDQPAVVRRAFGKGRVVLVSSLDELIWDPEQPLPAIIDNRPTLGDLVSWAVGSQPPVGGEARFSQTHGGGGGIYPELEERLPGAVVFYAQNQKDYIIKGVREELPKIADQLHGWLPSPVPEEPMFILLAAGGGGGWAVNAFYPKETGTISLNITSLYGIFAHRVRTHDERPTQ